jgi:hypothetical protein
MVATPARSDVIMDWNAEADTIAAEKRTATPTHGRGLAMLLHATLPKMKGGGRKTARPRGREFQAS